ncbi:MAG TPA: hypothetical protein VGJ26_03895 [Pirellulales bacterium]
MISQFDGNSDGALSKNEVPEQFQGFFGLIDQNRDGAIDVAEATKFVQMSGGSPGGFGRRQGQGQSRSGGGRRNRGGSRGNRTTP